MATLDDAVELLSEGGYQITPQRRYTLELCCRAPGHFTADDLFTMDREGERNLSRATIYNTLHVLVEVGFLRELTDLDSARYYEIRRRSHPHARCRSCGTLIDIPVDLEQEVQEWDLSFEVETVRMTVDGLCTSCGRETSRVTG